jgi:hypothetical protein
MAKGLFASNLRDVFVILSLLLLMKYVHFVFIDFILKQKLKKKNYLSLTFRAFTSHPFLKRTFSVDQSVDKGT